MPVRVTIQDQQVEVQSDKGGKPIVLNMHARKNLNGDIMIFDHNNIDIVLMPEKKKVVAFAKNLVSDEVYGAQNRLFDHLRKKGIVDVSSIRGGNIYGSIEAVIFENEELDAYKLAIVNISDFIDEERVNFDFTDAYADMNTDNLLHPSSKDSTELGEVPQETEKGSLRPGYVRDVYGLSSLYSY
jgi:hypothetical protein